MPRFSPGVTPLSLVICWPGNVDAAAAQNVRSRLDASGLEATWAIEQPSQYEALVDSLRDLVAPEIGVIISQGIGVGEAALDGALKSFDLAGQRISAIWSRSRFQRGTVERQLCQFGVRAVITPVRGQSSTVRQLPFGIWEFGSHIHIMRGRRWLPSFLRRTPPLRNNGNASPIIATINLGQANLPSSLGWGEVERLLQQASVMREQGLVRTVTIGELCARLSGAAATRPQRSILRIAA